MTDRLVIATALTAAMLPTLAFAQDSTAVSTSGSTSVSGSESGAVAGAVNEGLDQQTSVTFEGANIPRERYQAPNVTTVQAQPTAPCALTGGVGVSGPGFSASAGRSRINEQCMLYERARVIAQGLGDRDWAVELLRGSDPEADAAFRRAHDLPPIQGPQQ